MYVVAKNKEKLKRDLSYESIKNTLFKDKEYMKATREGTTDPDIISLRFDVAKDHLVG